MSRPSASAPYEVRELTQEENDAIKRIFTKDEDTYVRVGSGEGYVLPRRFLDHAQELKDMPLRPTDVFVVTYPRSGTTWTQELVWLLNNNLDFQTAKSVPLPERFPFLEFYMIWIKKLGQRYEGNQKHKRIFAEISSPVTETLAKMKGPRFIKSHLPISLLPEGILETTKVVYVARNPTDVAVSCYHFYKSILHIGIECEFKQFYEEIFAKDLFHWSPFFSHIKEGWKLRNHPNVFFIFYEELSKDLKGVAKRLAEFFGKQYSEQQYQQLCEHLDFKNFQKNSAVDHGNLRELGLLENTPKNFIRKGVAGGWRDHFDAEMTAHAQAWIQDNLRDTDLVFPLLTSP